MADNVSSTISILSYIYGIFVLSGCLLISKVRIEDDDEDLENQGIELKE